MPDASIRAARTADLPAITAVMAACQPYLIVTPESLAHSGGGAPPERFVSEVDGQVAGFAGIGPSHWGDGKSHAMQLVVLPDHRGKGVGTALMRRVEERFAASGGTRLVCGATGEDGLAFGRGHGFTVDRVNVISRLDLTVPVAEPEVPEGIRLVRIAELADLRPLYDTAMAAMRDIPGSLSQTTFTYERWERQNRTDPRDDRSLGTVALSGGEVAAFVQVQRSGERIHTNFTGTHPGHRGRGLATLVKRSALRAAADAGATAAYTVNDAENAPMLAVNTRLGYLPDIRRYSLERRSPAVAG